MLKNTSENLKVSNISEENVRPQMPWRCVSAYNAFYFTNNAVNSLKKFVLFEICTNSPKIGRKMLKKKSYKLFIVNIIKSFPYNSSLFLSTEVCSLSSSSTSSYRSRRLSRVIGNLKSSIKSEKKINFKN